MGTKLSVVFLLFRNKEQYSGFCLIQITLDYFRKLKLNLERLKKVNPIKIELKLEIETSIVKLFIILWILRDIIQP